MKQIQIDLVYKVKALKEEFTIILDNTDSPLSGELRVKLSKAELILNKIEKLLRELEHE